jgi:predicted MFS family arabinose efflux permease
MQPMYSTHLKQLGFDDLTIAACCATQAVATAVASLVAGQVADRWLSAERALAICALLSGIDLWFLANLRDPMLVFAATLFFWMVCGPMTLLGTTVTFTHLPAPERQFGPVRMWGTVGWMVIGWLISAWLVWNDRLTDAFRIGGLASFVLAGYALLLPPTPPRRTPGATGFAPLAALSLLRREPFLVYTLCMLGASITFAFSTQNTPLLLRELGVQQGQLPAVLTLAQVTEVAGLFILPGVLLALGLRNTMLLGLAAWSAAMLASALGGPAALVVSSLVLHGVYITGFMIAGQVYVNSQAEGGVRASVQGLFNCVNGVGLLLGSLLAGWLRQATGNNLPMTFSVAAGIALLMLALFAARFSYRAAEKVA